MAGKALKASGKRVMKYSRDGAVERDLAENSETRISGRTEDAVLKVEHTDERLNVHSVSSEPSEPEQKHRRHTPQEQQNTDTGQSSTDLKFEDKTFKFDDTVNPAPAGNDTAAGVPATQENTAEEQQTETPEDTNTAQMVADRKDIPDETPKDNSIIENLFAEFYGRDDTPADSVKSSGKFEFKKNEQSASEADKKRKLSRLQEDTKVDSKLITEAASTFLKQDTEKSSLAFVSAAVAASDGDAPDDADVSKSKRRTALKDKREDALSEESENADTLKFEHIDRSHEKQSHFADKLSDGSAASKKLKAAKGGAEEVSEEDVKRLEVRKQQRKAQQAEMAKKKAETSAEPLTYDEVTSAVRRARNNAASAEKKVAKAEVKLQKAEEKLPTEIVFHREREANKKSGKIRSKLKLEKEVKPQNRPDSFFQQGAKGAAATLTGAVKSRVHSEISKYEDDNAALKAAHKTEKAGESALKFTKDVIKRENDREKKAIYRKAQKLRFERDSAVKKANSRSSQLHFEETKAKKKAKDAARKAQRKMQRKKAQKAAKKTKSIIQKTAEVTQKVVTGIVHALSNPVVLIVLLIIALIIVLIFCLVSLFGSIGAESGTTIILSSYTSEDDQMTSANDYMSGLEAELAAKIQAIEEEYPDYDEYHYSIGQIGHNPYDLISFLTAKYQTFEFENVRGDIDALFDALYSFSATGREEQRQRVVNYTDTDGTIKTKTITYTVKILDVSLTATEFDEVVRSLLTDDEYARYELLKQTQGNRSDLF